MYISSCRILKIDILKIYVRKYVYMELIKLIRDTCDQVGKTSVGAGLPYHNNELTYVIKSEKVLNIQKLAELLDANMNGKVFEVDHVFIEITLPVNIAITSSDYYILSLTYKQVKIYLSEDVIPLDIIHLMLITMNDNVSFVNMLKSMDMKLSSRVYENFYKIKFPQDYLKVKHIVDKISTIIHSIPWGSLYLEKLGEIPSTETLHLQLSIKIHDRNPIFFDTFTETFIKYHLGTAHDYHEWVEYIYYRIPDNTPSKIAIYLQDIQYTRHVNMLYHLIVGETTTVGTTFSYSRFSDINHNWFAEQFVPYLTNLQSKHKEIDYMKYLSYEILIEYVKHVKDNKVVRFDTISYPMMIIEIYKRNPESAISDINEALES